MRKRAATQRGKEMKNLKKGSGKHKYDKGYTGGTSKAGAGDMRGNDFDNIKNKIKNDDKKKIGRQRSNKY